jgi:hypothetical protein
MFAKKIGITVLVTLLSLSAFAAPTGNNAPAGNLEGTWVVTVNLISPPPFLPSQFTATETYSRGGGMVTSNNMLQGPGQGAWEKDGDGYAVSILFFTHDPSGAPNGSIKVMHTISGADGDSYSGSGTARIYDPSGNLLAAVQFTSTGSRMTAR